MHRSERAFDMTRHRIWGGTAIRRAPRNGPLLAILALLAPLFACGTGRAGEVSYTLSHPSGTPPAIGGGNSLENALAQITDITNLNPGNDNVAEIVVLDDIFNSGLNNGDYIWSVDTGGSGIRYQDVNFDGGNKTISATRNDRLLNIQDADNVLVRNATFKEGKLTGNIDVTVDGIVDGAVRIDAKDKAIVTNVTLETNAITATTTNVGAAQIRGGGISVATDNGETAFTTIALDNNAINIIADNTGTTTVSGGGAYVNGGVNGVNTFNQNAVTDNTVTIKRQAGTDGIEAYGGGIAAFGKENVLSYAIFTGNSLELQSAPAGSTAKGGAGYFAGTDPDATNTLDYVIAGENRVTSDGVGSAMGGAFYMDSKAGSTIRNSALSYNKVEAGAGSALGGALYLSGSAHKIADSSITNNSVSGVGFTTGSAIFVDANAGATSLELHASAGNGVDISQNTVNGSTTHGGIAFSGANNASLNVTGSGTVRIMNGLYADVGANNFSFSKNNEGGRLELDGDFDFTAQNTNFSLDSGSLYLGRNFNAHASNDFTVDLTGTQTIEIDLARDQGTALFDFRGSSSKSISISDGTTITGSNYGHNRRVVDWDYSYLLIQDLDSASQAENVAGKLDFHPGGWYSGLSVEAVGTDVVANAHFNSPLKYGGTNALNMQWALQGLIDSDYGKVNITDGHITAWLNNNRGISPQLFMDQAFITYNGVNMVAGNAVNIGLRQAHRANLQSGAYAPFGSSRAPARRPAYSSGGYGAAPAPGFVDGGYNAGYNQGYAAPMGGQTYQGGQPYYNSSGAYPSARLMDCSSGFGVSGFRIFAGYVGDWRDVDSTGSFNGYKTNRNGFVIGGAYDFGSAGSLGFYGGYTKSRSKAKGADQLIKANNGHFGLMGRLSPLASAPELSFYGDFGYHFADNDMHRGVGGLSAKAKFDQRVFTVGLGGEYVARLGGINIVPQAEVRFAYLEQDDINEHGSNPAVTQVRGIDESFWNTRVAVEVSKDFMMGGMQVSPAVSVGWRHEFGSRNNRSTAYFYNSAGLPFRVSSGRIDQDSVDFGAAVKALQKLGGSKSVGVNLGYNYNVSSRAGTHSVYAGVEVGF